MDNTELREILLDDFDMQMAHVDKAVKQINAFDKDMEKMFFKYLSDKKKPEIIEGKYSFEDLLNIYQLTPIGAFLMLDWLRKDAETAEYILRCL